MVDGVDDQVLERVGDAVEHLLVELDVLAARTSRTSLPVAWRHVADDAGQRGEHPAYGDHRQAHRAVTHQRHAAALALDELAQIADGRGHLVAGADSRCSASGTQAAGPRASLRSAADPAGLLRGEAEQRAGGLLDAARAEVGLADGVEQVVDLGRGDSHRVRGLARGLGDLHVCLGRHGLHEHGYGDLVGAGDG